MHASKAPLIGPGQSPDTRARLLEAAAEVFAEVGYSKATVQEICRLAKANIAAVNYHFGDKRNLYMEVLRESHRRATEKFGPEPDLDSGPAEVRLRRFVESFLRRILDPDRPARHGRLMAREMVEPTGVLEDLMRRDIGPRHARLEAIVRELAGPAASEEQIRLGALSVLGQCVFFHHSRPMLNLLHPEHRYDHTQIESLTDHISTFTLAALRGLAAPVARKVKR
jgi:TetR/AcrR family transcriptional regulator, regulator of cefoperazone and chloramphenicol sensitivity